MDAMALLAIPPDAGVVQFPGCRNCFLDPANGRKCPFSSSSSSSSYSSFPFLSSSQKLSHKRENLVIVAAAGKKDKRKEDRHSFVPKPDEATGPFPEAVLLKQREVKEGGNALPEFADEEERELFMALNLELESDLDVERMRHYEVVYLIHEDHKEEVENINMKVQEFLTEKKGKLWRFSDWGMRRLAYKIQKAKNAHYILMNFELEAKWINDFKSMLDKDERVIRHLVIKKDNAETEECPPPPEFHTLRAGTDDDEADGEYDEDYEDEDTDEDEMDLATSNENNDGVIYVDEYVNDDIETTSSARRKKKAEKVGR